MKSQYMEPFSVQEFDMVGLKTRQRQASTSVCLIGEENDMTGSVIVPSYQHETHRMSPMSGDATRPIDPLAIVMDTAVLAICTPASGDKES